MPPKKNTRAQEEQKQKLVLARNAAAQNKAKRAAAESAVEAAKARYQATSRANGGSELTEAVFKDLVIEILKDDGAKEKDLPSAKVRRTPRQLTGCIF